MTATATLSQTTLDLLALARSKPEPPQAPQAPPVLRPIHAHHPRLLTLSAHRRGYGVESDLEKQWIEAHPLGMTKADMVAPLQTSPIDGMAFIGKLMRCPALRWVIQRARGDDQMPRDLYEFYRYLDRDDLPGIAAVCTEAELARLYIESPVCGGIDKAFQEIPALYLLWKITNSDWHWGDFTRKREDYRMTWNQMARAYNALYAFSFGLPDFDVSYVFCRPYGRRGTAEWMKEFLYLDATFGLLLSHKGQHVLTIGVSPTADGMLVSQVQLRQKKGNRWVYHLPGNVSVLEYALQRVLAACRAADSVDPLPVYLMRGESVVHSVRDTHSLDEQEKWTVDNAERLRAFYDQPLNTLRRDTTQVHSKTPNIMVDNVRHDVFFDRIEEKEKL